MSYEIIVMPRYELKPKFQIGTSQTVLFIQPFLLAAPIRITRTLLHKESTSVDFTQPQAKGVFRCCPDPSGFAFRLASITIRQARGDWNALINRKNCK
jgi:hypothetical protein